MAQRTIIIVFTISALLGMVHAAKILSIFPHSHRSHLNLGEVLFQELLGRGHTVTIVSQINVRLQHENLTNIHLDGATEHLQELGFQHSQYQNRRTHYVNEELIATVQHTTALMNFILGHGKMQKLLKGPAIYDVLLIDSYFSDSLIGLAYHWQIPAIALSTIGANKWSNELVGNPHKPAYNPSIYTEHTDRMTILQRLINSLESAFEDITYNYMYLSSQEAIFKRYFEIFLPRKRTLPPLIDLIHNVSLVLLNTHPAIHYPRAYVPNMIQIGGLHLNRTIEPLSFALNDYINQASDGVILINLGDTLYREFPSDFIDAFKRVFINLPENMKVIWKWDNVSVIENPMDKILTMPWIPQQAILAHPNCRLFITNGGTFSIMESIFYGVPIIVVPLFADQPFNAALIEWRTFGIKLDMTTINETIINRAVNEILTNSKYQRNILHHSQLIKDNSIDPLQNAIYYIEYVLRTGGARHLRSSSIDLPMWQQNLIDVWLLIAVAIAIILAIPATVICILLRRTHNAANSTVINNNNNKVQQRNHNQQQPLDLVIKSKLQQIINNKKKIK